MSRFIYRMQNILNIKEKLEESARNEFGIAMRKLLEEEEVLDHLGQRKAAYEAYAREYLQGSMSARTMRENKEAILRMDEYMADQRGVIRQQEMVVEQAREDLTEAMQERKIQEKLRENAFEQFMEDEKAAESREIDELTSYVYGQKNLEDE